MWPFPIWSGRREAIGDLCYGIGVDSTALLIELANREAPDLVLTADTGAEKIEIYAFKKSWALDGGALHRVRSRALRGQARLRTAAISRPHGIALHQRVPPIDRLRAAQLQSRIQGRPAGVFNKPWQPAIDAWRKAPRLCATCHDASPRDGQRNSTRSAHYPLNGCAHRLIYAAALKTVEV